MSAIFTDNFESGSLATNWPTVTGNAAASTAAAHSGNYGIRINPGGGSASQVGTTTAKWTQNTFSWALVHARFRFNSLPTTSTADLFTLQVSNQTDNFDFYYNNSTNDLEFDLKGATAFTHTGVTPSIGQWYELQARIFYNATTYTAEVMLDGTTYSVLNSTGETAGFARSFFIGTSSTSKTYQVDVDSVYIYLDTVQPAFRTFGDGRITIAGTLQGAPGSTTVSGSAALSASGTLAATGVVHEEASAALTASGALSGAGLARQQAASPLSSSSNLTAAGIVRIEASAALAASSALSASGNQHISAAAALTASGALSAAALQRASAAATLAASGTLTATATDLVPATAVLSATATQAVAALVRVQAAATLSGDSELNVSTGAVTGAASLAATAALTAQAFARVLAVASLSAAGRLTADAGGEVTRGVMRSGPAMGTGMDVDTRLGPRIQSRSRAVAAMGGS